MKFLKFLAWVVGILGAICLILYLTVFDVWTVPEGDAWLSVSIEPALSPGDVVIISRNGSPDRGHLVRCPNPQGGNFIIGRYIGKSGETITMNEEVISIDNTRTPSPRACQTRKLKNPETDEEIELRCGVEEYGHVEFDALRAQARQEPPSKHVVETGKGFLISDNRHLHWDSRNYGQVDPGQCQHILFRLWGAQGFGDSAKRFTFIW
jgi:signal peptidase I